MLKDGGVLAIQVPANHGESSHAILDEVCVSDRWRPHLEGVRETHVREPDWYADELGRLGFHPTVWQTTYRHRLTGDNPVLDWVKGTTLRPVLDRLDQTQSEAFLAEYGARIRQAYPTRNGMTVFPFTRTFMVAARI